MSLWLQDLRYAVRQVVNGRLTTVVTVVTLALGIGANSAVFTLIDATLFRPINVPAADRLVWVTEREGERGCCRAMSYPKYLAFRDRSEGFSGILTYGRASMSLGGGTPERVNGLVASGNLFEVLQLRPAVGRSFRPEEDAVPNAHPVAMLSEALWRRRYAADPRIVDSVITINGNPFTIIGVAPKGFQGVGLGDPADVIVPMAMLGQAMPGSDKLLTDARAGWLRTVGRLKPGVVVAQADASIALVERQLQLATHDTTDNSVGIVVPMIGGLDPSNRRQALPVFSLLMVVPVLVLIVACANVASMLLARGVARGREFAVRRALGATRGRLVRQLLTEALVLALLAGGCGILVAVWLIALITRLGNVPPDFAAILVPDGRVLAFTGGLGMLTTFLFGLVPALAATSPQLTPALKGGSVVLVAGRRRHRLRDVFVVTQLAVSLVLLITAGLFLKSLGKALRVDPGFDRRDVAVVTFDPALQGYSEPQGDAFLLRLANEARAVPGVTSVAFADMLPLSGHMMGDGVRAEGTPPAAAEQSTGFASVSDGYFSTMKIRLLRGREFTPQDRSGPALAIVNETLARRLWPDQDPIGKRLRMGSESAPLREVIGIVGDGKYGDLTEEARSFVYLPLSQRRGTGALGEISMVVRIAIPVDGMLTPLTRSISRLDPNLPLSGVTTAEQMLHRAADKQQAAAVMLGTFGTLALLLAALGLYGVTAHGVTLRTREIGIRMSLGARAADVLTLFVHEGVARSLVGVVIGLALSAALSKVLSKFLFGLQATDAITFATGATVLCLVAALASYVPARRAARADPVVALRSE